MKIKIGVVDTTFSRVNMGEIALDEIRNKYGKEVEVLRKTVPGIKDLAVECKLLLEKEKCDIALALGMVGGAPIDTQCAHEASLGIQQAKLMTNKHIVEVFVHENEAWNEAEFFEICDNRIRKHVHNAISIVSNPNELVKNAGMGVRQGKENEGTTNTNKEKQITIGIVVSEFNREITEAMENAALSYAKKQGLRLGAKIIVPGAYDIPLAAKKIFMDKQIDGIAALGAIITGKTKHDEVIAQATANALTQLSLEFNRPIALGIIGPGATDTDAEERKIEYAERAVETVVTAVKKLRR